MKYLQNLKSILINNYDSIVMPRIIGETIPDRMCFTFTPQNRNDVQEAMHKKEFANVSGCINTALRFYFENRNKTDPKDEFKEWLKSEEAAGYVTEKILKVRAHLENKK